MGGCLARPLPALLQTDRRMSAAARRWHRGPVPDPARRGTSGAICRGGAGQQSLRRVGRPGIARAAFRRLLDAEVQHLPADHQPLDLAGALADLGQLGVAQVALDLVLLDVAVAAVDLDRVVGGALGDLGGEQLGLRRRQREVQTASGRPRAGFASRKPRGRGRSLWGQSAKSPRISVNVRGCRAKSEGFAR